MKKVFTIALTLLTVSTTLAANKEGLEPSSGSGTMEVRMTNSESSSFGLILEIVNIEVYSSKNGWVTLNNYEQKLSSTSFMNGEESLLANSDIPFGTYSKLRLTFGNSNSLRSEINNISLNDLHLKQRQVEIDIFQQVNESNTNKVYIHFDLTTSVTVLEEIYVLNPVMEEITNPEAKKTSPDLNTISSTY